MSTCSLLQPLSHCPLHALLRCGFSPLPANLGDAFVGIRKRHLHRPKAAWPDISPTVQHSLVPTAQVALAFPASASFSVPLPQSLVLEGRGSGVGRGPSPCGWSLRVSVDRRVLSRQGHQDPRRTQLAALTLGESGQSPSPGAKMGPPCSGNTASLLHSVPRKAHPGLCPNP